MIDFGSMASPSNDTHRTVNLDLKKDSAGITLDLKKANGRGLRKVYFGASWDPVVTGKPVDIDTTAVALHTDNKWHTLDDVLYFNNRKTSFMEHSDDARTGAEVTGEGDDEYLTIDLTRVPADVVEVVLIATIYEGIANQQCFGQVRSDVHINDAETKEALAHIKLSTEYESDTSVILGSVKRGSVGWVFETSGQGALVEIGDVLKQYQG